MGSDGDATIYLSNETGNRTQRLERVVRRASRSVTDGFLGNIISLNDHKGDLTVTWKSAPSETERKSIEQAWESESELTTNVRHELNKVTA